VSSADNCNWVTQYEGTTFKLVPGMTPICGKPSQGRRSPNPTEAPEPSHHHVDQVERSSLLPGCSVDLVVRRTLFYVKQTLRAAWGWTPANADQG
jgi:hypothetical protein